MDGEIVHLRDFGLEDHPLRSALASEMHVRKLPPLRAPTRIMQVVLLREKSQVDHERSIIFERCEFLEETALPNPNFIVGRSEGVEIVWERHTEFSSYMFIKPGEFENPFDLDAFGPLTNGWFDGLQGDVVRGTQLALASANCQEAAETWFSAQDLVVCEVSGGTARLWSDFKIHPDGFGRLLLIDNGLNEQEASLVVQRLQELGNYRNMALLGLPTAQRLGKDVSDYEARLASLSAAMAGRNMPDGALLKSLVELSAELAEMVAQTRYRMNASRAYAQIVHDRLKSLRVQRIEGKQTLGDFTDRRLLPAVRTCVSFSARLEDLSQRAAWASSLMRTRVETALSIQNRDLLASMDRRTDLQLRLQQTVEGLSVVAISYYLVGLLGYVSKGLNYLHPYHDALIAGAVPLIILFTWLGLHSVTKRLHQD